MRFRQGLQRLLRQTQVGMRRRGAAEPRKFLAEGGPGMIRPAFLHSMTDIQLKPTRLDSPTLPPLEERVTWRAILDRVSAQGFMSPSYCQISWIGRSCLCSITMLRASLPLVSASMTSPDSGTSSLFAALKMATRKVHGRCYRRIGTPSSPPAWSRWPSATRSWNCISSATLWYPTSIP
jgi:hypothetical protein